MEESLRVLLPRIVLAFPFCAAVAIGQSSVETEDLTLRDLTQSASLVDPYLTKLAQIGTRRIRGEEDWLRHGGDEGFTLRGPTTVRHESTAGWFGPGTLDSVIADLAPELGGKYRLLDLGATMRVPAGLAPTARTLLHDLRANLPAPVRFDLELVRGDEVLLGRSVELRSGELGWASALVEGATVADYEVEIAQSAFTGNPVASSTRWGSMVVVRPHVATGEATGLAEVLVRVVEEGDEPPFDPGSTSCGAIDRVHQVVHEFAAVVPIRIGAAVRQRWAGPNGQAIELRFVPTWQAAAALPIGGRDVHYQPCWPTGIGFRSLPSQKPQGESEDESTTQQDFAEAIDGNPGGGRPVGPQEQHRFGVEGEAAALRAATRTRFARSAPVSVRLEWFDAPAGAVPDAEGRLADARSLGVAEVATVRDAWACVTAHEELTVVLDWDVEVAQSSRIADPKPSRLAAGLFLDLRCSDDEIELAGESSTRVSLAGRVARLSVPSITPPSTASGTSTTVEASVALPGETVRIDAPRVVRLPISAKLPLRRGEPTVWRARSTAIGKGREFVLLVRRVD